MSWGDLLTIVHHAPEGSAFFRAYYGAEESEWTLERQLFAAMTDALHVANWQRGSGKKRDYPEPIPRPGVGPERTKYGSKKSAVPMDEMAAWLGWVN